MSSLALVIVVEYCNVVAPAVFRCVECTRSLKFYCILNLPYVSNCVL